jgi:hypothetical protein
MIVIIFEKIWSVRGYNNTLRWIHPANQNWMNNRKVVANNSKSKENKTFDIDGYRIKLKNIG